MLARRRFAFVEHMAGRLPEDTMASGAGAELRRRIQPIWARGVVSSVSARVSRDSTLSVFDAVSSLRARGFSSEKAVLEALPTKTAAHPLLEGYGSGAAFDADIE